MNSQVKPKSDSPRPLVLYVDDEALARKYFAASIGQFADVVTASDPEEARSLLSRNEQQFAVIVSDERMPLGSGVDFLRDARKQSPFTTRILTSAYAEFDRLQTAVNDAGIYRFVPKPWDLDDLSRVVADALNERAAPAPEPKRLMEQETSLLVLKMAQSLLEPLREIESEAAQLVAQSSKQSLNSARLHTSLLTEWSSGFNLTQFAGSAARLQQEAANCLAIADAILKAAAKRRTLQ